MNFQRESVDRIKKRERNSVFSTLKPVCVAVSKDCSIENIDKLENAVKDLDSDLLQPLQEYILFPFMIHLSKSKDLQGAVIVRCIDFLTLILAKTKVNNWKVFVDIFNLLALRITNLKDFQKAANVSEELKTSVCKCILNLVKSSTEEILNEMYSLSFRPHLAHAFVVLSSMLKEEKSKSLLKAVLSAVGALTYNEKYIEFKYKMTEMIASEALASCLPGLSIALLNIVCSGTNQSHIVITLAINILTELIVLTIDEESFKRGIAADSSSEIHHMAYKSGKLSEYRELDAITVIIKDESWFKSTPEKLKIVIEKIVSVATHDHWKVRLEILKCAELLISRCHKTLADCIPVLTPIIFQMSVDKNEVVSSSAKETLLKLSRMSEELDMRDKIMVLLENNFEKLIAHLTSHKLFANDSEKLGMLKSILGYMELSGSSLNKLLFSVSSLERIVLTLLTLLEFDISELNLIEEIPIIADEINEINPSWPKKKFKYFGNEEILNVISRICHSLGRFGNAYVLIDYLLEKLLNNNIYTLQCIFVIGCVIKGLSEETDASQKYSSLISDILEIFVSSSLFDVPIHSNKYIDHNPKDVSSEEIPNVVNKNKLQINLIIEAIAYCAMCLGKEFKLYLMNVLCPVMEKAGNSNYIISQCGRICLYYIAKSCDYTSVRELITDNADYITNIIMINLHQHFLRAEAAVVLRVCMELSNADTLELFRDLIFQILEILDYNQDKAYYLMQNLLYVVVSIKKWFPSKKGNTIPAKKNQHKNLVDEIREYVKNKKMAFDRNTADETSFEHDEETYDFENSEDAVNDYVEDKKPEIPLHINVIREIFTRCINLQSSGNQFVRMLVLETVEQCIFVLCDYENQLQPLVHQYWSPFLRRFTEDTLVPKAFKVLLAIANECGDFIRRRTFNDVMPKLISFLKKEYHQSHKSNFRHYQWTSNHSLQVLVLSEIGNLCTKLDIDDKDINAVAAVCLPYLKKEQPQVLQEAAIMSLNSLASIDPDAIWFYFNVCFSKEKVLEPPSNDLLNLSFPHADSSMIPDSVKL